VAETTSSEIRTARRGPSRVHADLPRLHETHARHLILTRAADLARNALRVTAGSGGEQERSSHKGPAAVPDGNLPTFRGVIAGYCIVVLATLIAYGIFLRHGVAPAVVGYNLVPSERVLNGQIPYRDFVYNYTPGVLWLNALIFRLFGVSLMTARVLVYLAKVVSALLLYVVARRYLNPWAALAPVAMMLAWIGYGDLLKVFPTQYGMPLLLGAWLCALKSTEAGTRQARDRWLFAAGALTGLVFVFKQNVGVFASAAACGAVLVAAWLDDRSTYPLSRVIKSLATVVGGLLITIGPMCIYLAAHSALRPMLEHFLHHAAAYEEAKGIALPNPSVLLSSLAVAAAAAAVIGVVYRRSARLGQVCLGVLFAIALGIVLFEPRLHSARVNNFDLSLAAEVYYLPIYAIAAAAVGVLLRRRSGDLPGAIQLAIGALFALAAFLEIFPRSDADHLARVLPCSFIVACALFVARRPAGGCSDSPLDAGGHPSKKPIASSRARYITAAGLFLLTVSLGIRVTWAPQFDPGWQFHDRAPLKFPRGSGVMDTPPEAAMLNDVVAFIQSGTNPNEPILAVSRKMTGLYFFAARPNTTRLEWYDSPGIPLNDREDIYDRVTMKQFKLIVFGTDLAEMGSAETTEISHHQKRLLELVHKYYRQSGVIHGITCFAPAQ